VTITIQPIVCAAGGITRFTIRGLSPGGAYRFALLPVFDHSRLDRQGTANENGRLAWEQEVSWQGETLCDVFAGEADQPVATLHLYAVSQALAGCRPLRADFHIHTLHSDGRHTPGEMVVRGREVGLDALAITDHNFFDSSLAGIQIAQELGLGLACLPGEEVTSSTWHLVAVGAAERIGWMNKHQGYAGLRWAIDRIHELGGKAFLAHPYWIANRHLNSPVEEYERVLAEGGLDGIELLGEVPWEENLRSVARYYDLGLGERLPILGNSDTHYSGAPLPGRQFVATPPSGQTYGAYWTLILARERTPQAILEAVVEGKTAACARMLLAPETFPVQPRLVAFGPFELVDLALFLEAHYFPRHDALCRQEAEAARRILAGEGLPGEVIEGLEKELEEHYQNCWRG
jgi:hypothetical protein